MKFNKFMFPEAIKGTREPVPGFSLFMSMYLNTFEFNREGGYDINVSSPLAKNLHDINIRVLMGLIKRHRDEKHGVYHVCRDFFNCMGSVGDREINSNYLPEDFMGYISFPSEEVYDGMEYLNGAYVALGTADWRWPVMKSSWGKKFLAIGYVGEVQENAVFGAGRIVMEVEDGKTVEEILSQYNDSGDYDATTGMQVDSSHGRQMRRNLAKTILNILLYLKSEDPEIMSLTPTFGASHSHKKKHEKKGHLNECTIPVIAINWDYSRRQATGTKETFVESYPRWQRCGPQLSQIKLVFVTEHTRKYKTFEAEKIS